MTVTGTSAGTSADKTSGQFDDLYPDELPLDDPAEPAARILAFAATTLDSPAMAGVVKGSIWGMGVIATWERVICPVLRALEQLEPTGERIAVERLLSCTVSEALASVPPPGRGLPGRVVLACAEDEQHTLALQALSAALAAGGLSSASFGADTPPRALCRAVRRLRPAVAVVWSQTAATADPAYLRPLLLEAHRPTVVAAGPGWATATVADPVVRPDSFTDAVKTIRAAVAAATDERQVSGARHVHSLDGDSVIRWWLRPDARPDRWLR